MNRQCYSHCIFALISLGTLCSVVGSASAQHITPQRTYQTSDGEIPIFKEDARPSVADEDTLSLIADDEIPLKRGVELYGQYSFLFTSPPAINQSLAALNYPTLGSIQLLIGAGITYRMGRYMIGLEGSHTFNSVDPRQNDLASIRRRAWTMHIFNSYTVFQTPGGRIYPFVGISGTETTLSVTRVTPTTTFNASLTNQGNTMLLTHFKNALNIGVGMDAVAQSLQSSPVLGVRLGYRYSGASTWFSDYTPVTNAPTDHLNGFYIQVILGGSWNRARGSSSL